MAASANVYEEDMEEEEEEVRENELNTFAICHIFSHDRWNSEKRRSPVRARASNLTRIKSGTRRGKKNLEIEIYIDQNIKIYISA